MSFEVSDVVLSLSGRDAGKTFYVVGIEDEGFVLIADGRGRRVESPKRKKIKHLSLVKSGGGRAAAKLRDGERVTNSELRRALASEAALTEE